MAKSERTKAKLKWVVEHPLATRAEAARELGVTEGALKSLIRYHNYSSIIKVAKIKAYERIIREVDEHGYDAVRRKYGYNKKQLDYILGAY